jgi:hypothetical protein
MMTALMSDKLTQYPSAKTKVVEMVWVSSSGESCEAGPRMTSWSTNSGA